ncbi:MAG: DUF4249 domain-containing protein [Cyclobacteriaceae bacterium]|nr:DUF4249 domain-containing protein [Cyclobacteriaceae bacterium]
MKAKLIFLFIVSTISCIERVNIEIDAGSDLLVVEGGITNDNGPYELKLSLTTPYSTDPSLFGQERLLHGAKVYVIDVDDNTYTPMEMVRDGYYYTPTSFKGKIGHSYYVEITWNENVYESSIEQIKKVPDIDTIYYRQIEGTENLGLYADFQDGDLKNEFYLWRWEGYYQLLSRLPGPPDYPDTFDCCNVCYVPLQNLEVNLLEDRLINGNKIKEHLIANIAINEPAGPTSLLINIEQLSISEKEFEFWSRVKEQNENEGGLFDPIPSRLTGNMKNVTKKDEYVLGYFSVAGIKKSRIKIERGKYSNELPYFGPPNTFDCRSLMPNATIIKPEYWD